MALLAAGCGGTSTTEDSPAEPAAAVEARTGETFRLRVGGIAKVGRDGVLVAFRGIANDSRCPIDVVCVWQGDATAQIHVTVGRLAWTPFELHTALEPRAVRFQNYTVTLIAVEPAPVSTRPTDPRSYIVTLRVD